MKNYFAIIFSFFIVNVLFGQKMKLDKIISITEEEYNGERSANKNEFRNYTTEGEQLEESFIFGADSADWSKIGLKEKTYNKIGKLAKEVEYSRYSRGFRENTTKEYTYTPEGDLLSEIYSKYDPMREKSLPIIKSEYAYKKDTIKFLRYRFEQNQWIKQNRYDTIYSENGKIKTLNVYRNDNDNNWVIYDSIAYKYNTEEQLHQTLSLRWNAASSMWFNMRKSIYDYDGSNKVLDSTFTYESDAWVITSVSNWKHNNDNKVTLYVRYAPVNSLVNLTIVEQKDIAYEKLKETISVQQYNTTSSSLQNFSKTELEFDEQSNCISINDYKWDNANSKFEKEYFRGFKYNNEITYDDVLLPVDYEEVVTYYIAVPNEYSDRVFSDNPITEINLEGFCLSTGAWENIYNAYFDYSEFVPLSNTDITVKNTNIELSIAPNPTNSYITISGLNGEVSNFELFNSNGISVIKEVNSGEVIDVEYLPDGFYIYKITFKDSIYSGKILIK